MEHYMRTSTLEILFGQFEIIRTQDFEDLIKSKSGIVGRIRVSSERSSMIGTNLL